MRVSTVVSVALLGLLMAALTLATGCGQAAANKNTGNTGGDNATGSNQNHPANSNTATNGGGNGTGFNPENLANSDGICPVTGEAVSGDYVLKYKDRWWAFASENAMNTFLEDPDAYIAMAGGN